MESLLRQTAVVFAIMALAASGVGAETVVLHSGGILHGSVRTAAGTVIVATSEGETRLPARRVAAIVPDPRPATVLQSKPAAGSDARDPLAALVSVDAEAASLRDVLADLRRQTGVPISVSSRVALGTKVEPEEAESVPLVEALDRALSPHGLRYRLSEGRLYVFGSDVVETEPEPVVHPLVRRMDVDFDQVPLREVLVYLRETTGFGLAMHDDLNADPRTVTLHLRNAPLERILDLTLLPRGYGYRITSDNVLMVLPRHLRAGYRTELYNVTDLLLSTNDLTGGSRDDDRSSGRASSGRSIGINPQYGRRGGSNGDDDDDREGFSRVSDRAENLVLLMKQACHPDEWAAPASTGLIDVGRED